MGIAHLLLGCYCLKFKYILCFAGRKPGLKYNCESRMSEGCWKAKRWGGVGRFVWPQRGDRLRLETEELVAVIGDNRYFAKLIQLILTFRITGHVFYNIFKISWILQEFHP